MNPRKAVAFSLPHRVSMSKVADHLSHQLNCQHWHVVCHQEHRCVIHLAEAGSERYAVSFECTPPVEKGIYHGSMTSHLSLVPLGEQTDLPPAKVDQIKTELSHLGLAAAAHLV